MEARELLQGLIKSAGTFSDRIQILTEEGDVLEVEGVVADNGIIFVKAVLSE